MSSKEKQSFSWLSLLQVVLIVLKLTNLTNISWWWIFAPMIFTSFMVLVMVILLAFTVFIKKK